MEQETPDMHCAACNTEVSLERGYWYAAGADARYCPEHQPDQKHTQQLRGITWLHHGVPKMERRDMRRSRSLGLSGSGVSLRLPDMERRDTQLRRTVASMERYDDAERRAYALGRLLAHIEGANDLVAVKRFASMLDEALRIAGGVRLP